MRPIARLLLALLALLLPACGPDGPDSASKPKPATLVFWNWPDYVTQEALTGFERETGHRVELRIFEDEEVLMGAIQSSEFQGDILVVSNTLAEELAMAQLLAPLDPTKIPNAVHVEAQALTGTGGPVHDVPYLAGTTGIVVNTKHVPQADSWNVLWNETLSGRIAMLPNGQEIVPAASKMLGYGILPRTEAEFQAVRRALLAQRPLLRGYLPVQEIVDLLIEGELWAAQIYSGDALLAREANPDLRYFVPREGGMLWTDKLVIPRASRHKNLAMAFVDYLQRPEVMAKLSAALHAPTPNLAARKLQPKDVLGNPDIYPPQDVLARCEYYPPFRAEDTIEARIAELWSILNRK